MARVTFHPLVSDPHKDLVPYVRSDSIVLEVVLSEKNIFTLVTKLYDENSQRTLFNNDTPDGYVLKLIAETDEVHYASKSRNGAPPGFMLPKHAALAGVIRDIFRGITEEDNEGQKVLYIPQDTYNLIRS